MQICRNDAGRMCQNQPARQAWCAHIADHGCERRVCRFADCRATPGRRSQRRSRPLRSRGLGLQAISTGTLVGSKVAEQGRQSPGSSSGPSDRAYPSPCPISLGR